MPNLKTKPIRIKAFLDGSPGHQKQTIGILKALEKLAPVNVEYKTVKPALSSYIKNGIAYLIGKAFRFSNTSTPSSFDIIIGTGTHTCLPVLIEKEKSGAKAATCMTPEPFLINKFDLCFIPFHDKPEPRQNILATIGPPNLSVYNPNKNDKKGLILVGGADKKNRHYKWDTNDITKKIEKILTNNPAIQWTISSSPRTPIDASESLKKIASNRKNAIFFDYKDTPEGWVEKEYDQSRYVCLTTDSMSMIYEAITAGCIVGIIPILWKKKNNKFQESIRYLIKNRYVVSADAIEKEQSALNDAPLNEAARCAKEILERWHPQKSK
jgi:mitochondrial fission protein ELM1